MKFKKLNITTLAFWLLTSSLLLIDQLSNLEVDLVLRLFTTIMTACLSLSCLIVLRFSPYRQKSKYPGLIIFSIASSLILLFYQSIDSEWKTQTILFEKNSGKQRVEFQMKDIGARGYLRRTVKLIDYLYFFSLVEEVNKDSVDTSWRPVNKEVNKMGLKGG